MKRSEARKLAETITNQQIFDMLEKAKVGVKDWTKVSIVNKGMTKGTAWNLLGKDFDVTFTNYHVLAKTNILREFGEFLPEELQPPKRKKLSIQPFHQEPIF